THEVDPRVLGDVALNDCISPVRRSVAYDGPFQRQYGLRKYGLYCAFNKHFFIPRRCNHHVGRRCEHSICLMQHRGVQPRLRLRPRIRKAMWPARGTSTPASSVYKKSGSYRNGELDNRKTPFGPTYYAWPKRRQYGPSRYCQGQGPADL